MLVTWDICLHHYLSSGGIYWATGKERDRMRARESESLNWYYITCLLNLCSEQSDIPCCIFTLVLSVSAVNMNT